MPPKLKILQINLNNCSVAKDMMLQKIQPEGLNVAIISEYYNKHPAWLSSLSGRAALWISPHLPVMARDRPCAHFFSDIVNKVLIISVYFPPNNTFANFSASINDLCKFINKHR